jgi:hypothetical protein
MRKFVSLLAFSSLVIATVEGQGLIREEMQNRVWPLQATPTYSETNVYAPSQQTGWHGSPQGGFHAWEGNGEMNHRGEVGQRRFGPGEENRAGAFHHEGKQFHHEGGERRHPR